MLIAHIIARDKFTNGYIKFMQHNFPETEQWFFTIREWHPIDEDPHVIEIGEHKELWSNPAYKRILKNSDKIIVSGVWMPKRIIAAFLGSGWIKKTYFQFWGGDFYDNYRDKPKGLRDRVTTKIVLRTFRKAAGLIFLIDGEYEKFREITGVSNRHFVAPMPNDPKTLPFLAPLRDNAAPHDGINVLVGNSATEGNCHEEAFRALAHLKNEKIKFFCPLSYGDPAYAEITEQKGFEILSDAFIPMKEFMDKDKYYEFLSTIDVGVFFNNRQQAMGNILILLGLGKKVYVRSTTSTWKSYEDGGYTLYPAESVANESFEAFRAVDEDARTKNIAACDAKLDRYRYTKLGWDTILEEALPRGGKARGA